MLSTTNLRRVFTKKKGSWKRFWIIFSNLDHCVKSWRVKYSPFSHDRTNAQCKKDKNRRPCISNPRRTNIVFIIPVTNLRFGGSNKSSFKVLKKEEFNWILICFFQKSQTWFRSVSISIPYLKIISTITSLVFCLNRITTTLIVLELRWL